MLLTNLTRQLKGTLPYYTELFSDKIAVTNLNYNSNTYEITINTVEEHGLEAGDFVIINGIRNKYKLFNIDYNGDTGVLTAELDYAHEVFITDKQLTLAGFSNNEFNNTFYIISLEDCIIKVQLPKT